MPNKRVTTELRRTVTKRAHGYCEYCRSQARFATQSFSVEHIHPRKFKGKTELNNLALACPGCNGHKHTKTKGLDAVTAQLVPLYHPRQEKWNDHFRWNDDFTQITGLTPTGRATIETLQLNREGLVNLREVLHAMGKHPPLDLDEDE